MTSRLEKDLHDWQAAKVQTVPLKQVKTHPALQPRDASATFYQHRKHEERQSTDHLLSLRTYLEAAESNELAPIMVCRIDSKLYVVDGHHRLEATRRAGRSTIEARVKSATLKRAVQLSRLVNVRDRSLPLSKGQVSEAMWQHIADITRGGELTLQQAGTSQRRVLLLFGKGGKTTVGRMVDRLEFARELKEAGKLDESEVNAYTKWPTWKAVCRQLNPNAEDATNGKVDRKLAKMATTLSGWIEDVGIAEVRKALRIAQADAAEDAADDESEESDF